MKLIYSLLTIFNLFFIQAAMAHGSPIIGDRPLIFEANSLFVANFENDRNLVIDRNNDFQHQLSEAIEKPTDWLLVEGVLKDVNYSNGKLNSFSWMGTPVNQNISEDTHNHN
jgi:hypothetical protein